MSSNKEFVYPRRVIQTNRNGVITDIIEGGITLRDYFAAKALQGFCSQMPPELIDDISQGIRAGGNYVKAAGYLADSMLEELEKGQM